MSPRGVDLGLHSLEAKLLWGAVLLLSLLMATVTVVVEQRQRDAIVGEFDRRGEVLARNLAAISLGPLLLYNFTVLEQNAARVASEDDVVYAIVLDADGKVAAHSRRPERIGISLTGDVHERAARAESLLVQQTVAADTQESLYDFSLPVEIDGQKWGTVRVGLTKRRMDEAIRRTRLELGLLALGTLVLGGVVAAVVARRIAGPVRELEHRAAAIARGELDQRIEPTTFDEIGRLAIAFNHMAAQLLQQRSALEEVHFELQRRFQELADVKSYTDSIVNSLTNGIITVDLEGRVVTLNPAAELLTGFFAGEAGRRYCTEVFGLTPEIGDILMETLASRAPIGNVPLTLRRRNGSGLPVELSSAPLKGGDGKDLGAVGILRDLTVVRQLESQLRRSDRLAAVGTLAAGLAHEIKNPLTSLRTFISRVASRFDDARFRERFQSVVPRELERINRIVERLLELARPPRMSFSLVRLPALLERIVELYEDRIETSDVTVTREFARDVPPIQADEEALYRALVNLVANALDAMTAGGRLTLRLGWSEGGDPPGRVRRAFNRRLRLEVQDSGTGIPASATDRIFNPFFTTKDTGTGLGLAITHKIVQDHGGSIDFRSVRGGGTVFRIVLPLVPDLHLTSEHDDDPR